METGIFPYPVHVISLRSRTDRRAWITEHLRQIGLPFVFLDALALCDEPCVRLYDPVRFAQHQSGGELVREQALACTLSHYRLWRQTSDAGTDWALVLEDDARFTCIRPIPLLNAITAKAGANDVVLLNSHCQGVSLRGRVSLPRHRCRLYRINDETCLSGGYLLSRGAARRLAEAVEHDGIIRVVDWWQRRQGPDWSRLAPIRVAKPDPVVQDPGLWSDIADNAGYFDWAHDDMHREAPIFTGLVKRPRNPRYWPLFVLRLMRRLYACYTVPPRCLN